MNYSITLKKDTLITANNRKVVSKILKGIEKYYKPKRKLKFKLVGESK